MIRSQFCRMNRRHLLYLFLISALKAVATSVAVVFSSKWALVVIMREVFFSANCSKNAWATLFSKATCLPYKGLVYAHLQATVLLIDIINLQTAIGLSSTAYSRPSAGKFAARYATDSLMPVDIRQLHPLHSKPYIFFEYYLLERPKRQRQHETRKG